MTLNPNQFVQTPILGMADLHISANTLEVQVDASQATPLLAGQSVKIVDSLGGIPKVVAVAADADEVYGFIRFDVRRKQFVAGDVIEIAGLIGSCIYLQATAAIARGAHLKGVVATVGGVATAVLGSGSPIIGHAYDKAVNAGDLIRVVTFLPAAFKA